MWSMVHDPYISKWPQESGSNIIYSVGSKTPVTQHGEGKLLHQRILIPETSV